MATISKARLESVLRSKLGLKEPGFRLEKAGDKLSGSIISPTFLGKKDHERQRLIWEALDDEFGAESVHLVGTLLAYTPEEWGVNLEAGVEN